MQHFRFTIIDYTTNPVGNNTVIDEPVGWDGLAMKLSRHTEWHGFFDYFDDEISSLQFDGEGFGILKSAWNGFGMNARLELLIEYACGDTDAYEELYTGRFDFSTYEEHCGDRCYIQINVETTSCLTKFKSRYDQKVDIESLTSFDGETLPAYAGIGFDMDLPAKLIVIKSWWEIQLSLTNTFITLFPGGNTVNARYWYSPEMPSLVADMTNTSGGVFTHYEEFLPQDSGNTPSQPLYWVMIQPGQSTVYTNFDIQLHLQGTFTDEFDSGDDTGTYSSNQEPRIQVYRGADWLSSSFVSGQFITDIPPYGGGAGSGDDNFSFTFSQGLSTNLGTVNPGEGVFVVIRMNEINAFVPGGGMTRKISWTLDPGSYIRFTSDTISETTESKCYLINEVASRATEAVTDDCLRVYSDLLGRTDAEPYPSAADGCAALEVLTTGLLIRRATLQDATEPKLTISMKQVFESLNPIWNIGMGVEDDPARPGYQLLRIEKFQHFYSNSVLISLDKIASVQRSVHIEDIVSVFKIGFAKWEAEQYNGLDEFLTKREFRTTLSTVSNEFEQFSAFIASGYAIEITRRQGPTSKDWRYDNDTFVVCVYRYIDHLGNEEFRVEQDTINADNIVDPSTVYNTRISPARNARRWMPIVFQCYVDYGNGVLKFITGDGNIVAESNILSIDAACSVEDTAAPKPVVENGEINYTEFDSANVADFLPIFKPERVTFDYPLTYTQWKLLKANPTGLVEYQCGNGPVEQGWIDELSYKPVEGMASFVLIPKQGFNPVTEITVSASGANCDGEDLVLTASGSYEPADAVPVGFVLEWYDGYDWIIIPGAAFTNDGTGNYALSAMLDSSLQGTPANFRIKYVFGTVYSTYIGFILLPTC